MRSLMTRHPAAVSAAVLLLVWASGCGARTPAAPASSSTTTAVSVPAVTAAHLAVTLASPADGATIALASSPATLSATVPAPPAGASIVDVFEYSRTADFSVVTAKPVVRTGTTASITLALSSADADDDLYWRVRAQSGELIGASTSARRLHVALDTLGKPSLLVPADGTIQPASPHFQIQKLIHSADAFDRTWSYDLEVAGDPDFRSLAYSARIGESVTSVVFHTLPIALPSGTYYWRARAFDGRGGAGDHTSAWRFEVAEPFAMTPTPVTPFAGATIIQPATFGVQNDRVYEGPSGTRNEVQVSLTPAFTSIAASGWAWAANRAATSVNVSPVLGAGAYYWRTRSVLITSGTQPEIASVWSATRAVTVGGQVLGAPTLVEPAPGATSALRPTLTIGPASRTVMGTAIRYQLELSTDSAFAATSLVTATVDDVNGQIRWTSPFDLPVGLPIWWRARAEEPASGTVGPWASSRFVPVDSSTSLYQLVVDVPASCAFAQSSITFYVQSTDAVSAGRRRFTAHSPLNTGDLVLSIDTAADRSVTGTLSGFATAGPSGRNYTFAAPTDPRAPANVRGAASNVSVAGTIDTRLNESSHSQATACTGTFNWTLLPRL